MSIPNISHPTKFKIKGMIFEVISYGRLTNDQAAKIAMHFYRSHKFKKSDQGKLFQVMTQFDSNSANLL
jgi:hypothetical protein